MIEYNIPIANVVYSSHNTYPNPYVYPRTRLKKQMESAQIYGQRGSACTVFWNVDDNQNRRRRIKVNRSRYANTDPMGDAVEFHAEYTTMLHTKRMILITLSVTFHMQHGTYCNSRAPPFVQVK